VKEFCPVNDVTRILESARRGESKAAEELLPLLYNDLRKLSAAKMAREPPGQTLQPTAHPRSAQYIRAPKTKFYQW
jgi:hypothetical protein